MMLRLMMSRPMIRLDAFSHALFSHTPRPVRFISHLTSIHRAGSTTGWLGTALATGLILLLAHAAPAAAQSERGYEARPSSPETVQGGADDPAGASLPPWAEPQRPSSHPSSLNGDPGPGPPVAANGLGPPDNPNRVPLGGIEWLMLAGAGYGAFRLRKTENH
jgi:hypothetical protein